MVSLVLATWPLGRWVCVLGLVFWRNGTEMLTRCRSDGFGRRLINGSQKLLPERGNRVLAGSATPPPAAADPLPRWGRTEGLPLSVAAQRSAAQRPGSGAPLRCRAASKCCWLVARVDVCARGSSSRLAPSSHPTRDRIIAGIITEVSGLPKFTLFFFLSNGNGIQNK